MSASRRATVLMRSLHVGAGLGEFRRTRLGVIGGREVAPQRALGYRVRVVLGRVALVLPALLLLLALNAANTVLRGTADDTAPFASVSAEGWDRAVFGGVPAEMLQNLHGTDGAWARVGFLYWASLFWVPFLLVGTVALSGGHAYLLRLLLFMAAVLVAADLAYALVPTRPPWMDVDVIRMVAVEGHNSVDIDLNPYAALPSLHVAVPLLFAVWFFAVERAEGKLRLSPILFLWSIGMAWSVVYTGEHYVADVVAGVVWVGAIYWLFNRFGWLLPQSVPGVTEASAADPVGERPRAKAA